MQTLELYGEQAGELGSILEKSGWIRSGVLWQREGRAEHLRACCGSLRPGLLPLGNDPEKAASMLRWFFDWQIRPATTDDLPEMCQLKARSIRETFLFLDSAEREREVQSVAGEEHMKKEITENSFWVCRRDEELWALGGLQEISPDEGLVYSGYSRGDRAGAALLALRIYEAEKRGQKKLWANVYGYNEQSPGHLRYQGFRLSNRLRTSHCNPPHRIRGWSLNL